MSGKQRLLIQFAKTPVPGQVKTRLMPAYSAEEACEIHRRLVSVTAQMLQQCIADARLLKITGDPEADHWRSVRTLGFRVEEQSAGDLGDRMRDALNQGLAHYRSVILVGSDCPALTPDRVATAFAALEAGDDLVLGPAEDGGYVLIGASRTLGADIFREVSWGGDQVFQDTRHSALSMGLKVGTLPLLWDVDHPEDVARWLAE